MKGKFGVIAVMALITVLFVSGCTTQGPPAGEEKTAAEFCGQENVAGVYECSGYVKVVSSLLGGGATYYNIDGQPVSCPVVGPDAESQQCRTLSQLECTDACTPAEDGTGPIGGQRDEHGCLGPAGYTWNETIGACVRLWELDESQKEAAGIAVDFLGWEYATTVTSVATARCPGCFSVAIEQGEARDRFVVTLADWEVSESTWSYHQCTNEEKAAEICTMEYMPVCGYMPDGTSQTYGNDCGACAADAEYWESGEC
jgi:hypothetical protein